VLVSNAAFARSLSKDGTVVGAHLTQLLHEADRPRAQGQLDAARNGGAGVGSFDAAPLHASPGSLTRSLRFHPSRASTGEIFLTAVPAPPGRASDELRLTIF